MKRVILVIAFLVCLTSCKATTTQKTTIEKIDEAYQALVLDEIAEQNLDLVKESVYGVLIEWTSNEENVLSSKGEVTPREEDTDVILTATLRLEQEQRIKQFYIKVPGVKIPNNINYTENYQYQIPLDKVASYPYYKGYTFAGLLSKNGKEHREFKINETTGATINVKLFGAKPNDESHDNTEAFKKAIASAKPGDEVFVPEGRYYFSSAVCQSPYYAHIQLKAGVNIRGVGKDKSILISNFKNKEYINQSFGKKTATLVCGNGSNCMISDLGITANTDDSALPKDYNDTRVNNPDGNQYAPAFGIVIYNTSTATLTENVYIHDIFISYFQYDGIRLYCTRNCKIADCIITKATDIGGGGAGYGIEIRGYGHEYFKYIDTNLDSRYNIVERVQVVGPYIRHGIILSYMTHNNLFYNNQVLDSADDAFDVHGQDEFLNVFSKNYARGSRRGAGLGLGNTGSTHDESGYGNVLYKNYFENCKYGVTVARGTSYTQVIENKIQGCNYGIYINNGPYTYQYNNSIC